jgi:hypothetical protein
MDDKGKWTVVSSLSILADVLRFKVLQLKKENMKLKNPSTEIQLDCNGGE